MKVKFIGKQSLRFNRRDFHPGEVVEVANDLDLPSIYFEFLDKKVESNEEKVEKPVVKKTTKKNSKKGE